SPSAFPLSHPKSRIISLLKRPNHGLMGESLSQPRAFGVSVAHRSAPQCNASREAPALWTVLRMNNRNHCSRSERGRPRPLNKPETLPFLSSNNTNSSRPMRVNTLNQRTQQPVSFRGYSKVAGTLAMLGISALAAFADTVTVESRTSGGGITGNPPYLEIGQQGPTGSGWANSTAKSTVGGLTGSGSRFYGT